MKNLILIFALALFSLTSFGQTLIHTDVALIENDTILFKWYHEKFIDSDNPVQLVSRISLVKEYHLIDTTYFSSAKTYNRILSEGDSLKDPYGDGYFQYEFVKNYIYQTGENMKRTLSLYQILNYQRRVFE